MVFRFVLCLFNYLNPPSIPVFPNISRHESNYNMNTTKTLTRRPQSKPARSRVLGAAPPSKPTEGTSAYVQQNGKAKMTEPVKAMLLEDGPDIPNKNGVEHITRSSSRVADDINNVSPIFYDDVLPVPSARKLSFRTKVNKTETEYRTNEGTPLNRLEDLEESNEENNSLACPICNETMVTLLQLNRYATFYATFYSFLFKLKLTILDILMMCTKPSIRLKTKTSNPGSKVKFVRRSNYRK